MQHTRDRTRTGLYLGLALCFGLALLTNAMEAQGKMKAELAKAEPQGRMESELAALTNAMEAEPQGKSVKVEDGGVSDNHDDNDDKEMKSKKKKKTKIENGPIQLLEDPKIPVTVLLGATGAGKSTFGDMLGRLEHPDKHLFDTSGQVESDTKKVASELINVNPQNQELIGDKQLLVVDTPGFGDSDGCDSEIRSVMIQHLTAYKNKYKEPFGVNNFVILYDWHTERLNDMIREMVLYLVEMWSENFIDHVTIVVTNWPYDRAGRGEMEAETGDATDGLVETKAMFIKEIREEIVAWFEHYRAENIANAVLIPEQRVDQIRAGALDDKIFFIDSTYDYRSGLKPAERTKARQEVVRFLETMKTPKYPCLPGFMKDVKDKLTRISEDIEKVKAEQEQVKSESKATIDGLEKHIKDLQRRRDIDRELFQNTLREEELDREEKMRRQEEEQQRQREYMELMEEFKRAKNDAIRDMRKQMDEMEEKIKTHKEVQAAVQKKMDENKSCWENIVSAVGGGLLYVSKAVNLIPVVGQAASVICAAAGGICVATAEISRACKK